MENQVILNALAQALASQLGIAKHTTPTGIPSLPYWTGPGGLFGVPGLDRDMISTRVQARGLASRLPAFPSMDDTPLFPYLTGFQAETGEDADGVCDDCPTAGSAKSCIQTAQFGRYCEMTRELEINRVGMRLNRGEFLDYRLVNDPLVNDWAGIFAQNYALGSQESIWAGQEMVARMVEVGVAFQNKLCPQIWTGNPANNSAGGGYKEFPGLDILIGVNKVDALTNQSCPSLYSDIKDFQNELVDNLNGKDIVHWLTTMFRFLSHNAESMNFGDVTWVIVMREGLFFEATDVWLCRYAQYRCVGRDTAGLDPVGSYDAMEMSKMRDAMRNGRYLLIDGVQREVVIDDCITETVVSPGVYSSDIYIVPLTVRGGFQATYWQYLDYSKGALPAAKQGGADAFYWTDGGRFLWHSKPPLNWCIQQLAKIEPRIILRTPHLAGRLINVAYSPLQHFRDPLPDQSHFTDGGVTEGHSFGQPYSDWDGRYQ